MAELEDRFGLPGYARWFKLLEKIGQVMGGENGCSATYPWTDWQRFLKGKRNKLDSFLVHLENKQKINLKRNGNILEIECPKLLEIRDEYSKKSGQSPGNVRPKSTYKHRTQITERECGEEPPPPGIDFLDLDDTQPDPQVNAKGNDHAPTDVHEFLSYVVTSHQEVRGSKYVEVDKVTNVERVRHWLEVDELSLLVLCQCWDYFLRDSAPWLAGKPRTLAIFGSRLSDYLAESYAVEQEEWQKQEAARQEGNQQTIHLEGIKDEFLRLKTEFDRDEAEALIMANGQFHQKYGCACLREKDTLEVEKWISDHGKKRDGERQAQEQEDQEIRRLAAERNKKVQEQQKTEDDKLRQEGLAEVRKFKATLKTS